MFNRHKTFWTLFKIILRVGLIKTLPNKSGTPRDGPFHHFFVLSANTNQNYETDQTKSGQNIWVTHCSGIMISLHPYIWKEIETTQERHSNILKPAFDSRSLWNHIVTYRIAWTTMYPWTDDQYFWQSLNLESYRYISSLHEPQCIHGPMTDIFDGRSLWNHIVTYRIASTT